MTEGVTRKASTKKMDKEAASASASNVNKKKKKKY